MRVPLVAGSSRTVIRYRIMRPDPAWLSERALRVHFDERVIGFYETGNIFLSLLFFNAFSSPLSHSFWKCHPSSQSGPNLLPSLRGMAVLG